MAFVIIQIICNFKKMYQLPKFYVYSISNLSHLNSIRQNSLEFLRPVFLYAMCNPNVIDNTIPIWTCLLSQSVKSKQSLELLYEILSWSPVSNFSYLIPFLFKFLIFPFFSFRLYHQQVVFI